MDALPIQRGRTCVPHERPHWGAVRCARGLLAAPCRPQVEVVGEVEQVVGAAKANVRRQGQSGKRSLGGVTTTNAVIGILLFRHRRISSRPTLLQSPARTGHLLEVEEQRGPDGTLQPLPLDQLHATPAACLIGIRMLVRVVLAQAQSQTPGLQKIQNLGTYQNFPQNDPYSCSLPEGIPRGVS